jgi:hypothetical protein
VSVIWKLGAGMLQNGIPEVDTACDQPGMSCRYGLDQVPIPAAQVENMTCGSRQSVGR